MFLTTLNSLLFIKFLIVKLHKVFKSCGIVAREVIGNYVVIQTAKDETLIAPVTDLWVQQNARLEYFMKLYNQKFNKQ